MGHVVFACLKRDAVSVKMLNKSLASASVALQNGMKKEYAIKHFN